MLEFVTKFGFAPIFLLAVMVRKNFQGDFALPQESVKVNCVCLQNCRAVINPLLRNVVKWSDTL